jgi:integrase
MKLTEKTVAEAIAEFELATDQDDKQIGDEALPGLRLRLRRGRKGGVTSTWRYQYKDAAGDHIFTLDVTGTSLGAARKWAGGLQALRRVGRDPAREREEGRHRAQQTFATVIKLYLSVKAELVRSSTRKEIERHLLTHCASLHRLPMASINTGVLSTQLASIAKESGSTTADNVRRTLNAFWMWAVRRSLAEGSPVAGVERRRPKSRNRVLTADELRAIWRATAEDTDFNIIVRILLLSGMRAGEVAGLRWSEVYSDRIVLPGERVKNGRERAIPITPQIAALLSLRSRTGVFVFGRTGHSGFSGWSKAKKDLDKATKIARPWVLHDLRRTLATGLNELAVAPHVVEMLLGHVSFRAGIAGVYNLAGYEGAVRHALLTWEAHILEIAEGRVVGDRVVPLRRA